MKTIQKQISSTKTRKTKTRKEGRPTKSRQLLSMKERALLLYSDVIKDYPWLKDFLEKNKHIKEKQLNTLTDEQKNFMAHMLGKVLTQASTEWIGDFKLEETLDSKERRCALCNTKIKYVYCINNQLNNNSLIVGNICIKDFEIKVKGFSDIKLLNKQAHRLLRLAKLNQAFPGITAQVDKMLRSIDEHPILISGELDKSLREELASIREMISEFETKKRNEDVFKDIKERLAKCQKLLGKIDEYVDANVSKKHIPSRPIVNWLKARNLIGVIDQLKVDKFITWRTAHRIAEPEFMRSTAKEISRGLKPIGGRISQIDEESQKYLISTQKRPKVLLFSAHNNLVLTFGWLMFDNEEPIDSLSLENLVKNCGIFYDEQSISESLEEIKRQLNRSALELQQFDTDFNSLIIYSRKTDRYLMADLRKFLAEFKEMVFGVGKKTRAEIEAYVDGLRSPLYTKGDLKRFLKDREDPYARQKTFR